MVFQGSFLSTGFEQPQLSEIPISSYQRRFGESNIFWFFCLFFSLESLANDRIQIETRYFKLYFKFTFNIPGIFFSYTTLSVRL